MGVFDFVKNAGAKIGIGKSTDEEEAEEAAAKQAAARKAAKERAEATRAKIEERKAKESAEAERQEKREAVRAKVRGNRLKAAASARMANYRKATELEDYVEDLGIDITGIDIRFDDETAFISGSTANQETKEKIILAVGNAQGVAKVDEEIEVTEAADPAVFHTVVSGDTLWAIAEKVYGDGSRYPEIFEANKPMLTDPDLIFPGQVLRCPK
jgi:nucleoid-associated protein YgaU